MKVVILAGGLGTRISEETQIRPKPMVEIGGKPIIWHIMKIYSHYGFNDFIICLGYKGYIIKEYFLNYFLHQSDVTLDLSNNSVHYHNKRSEPWKVTLIDTGAETNTGGRLKRLKGFIDKDETFMMTYGDGVADIDLNKLIDFHSSHPASATLTSVTPPGRFGALKFVNQNEIVKFTEKPSGDGTRINGGFFVLRGSVLDLIENDETIWEQKPLETLAEKGELRAFHHDGFWQPMDTLRDKVLLEDLWGSGSAPWKLW
jgi:glucose-1-phosphate cytidylyltransferase